MGKSSSKLSPYEILGITKYSTLKETLKQYAMLHKKYSLENPAFIPQLNAAFDYCQSAVNFEIYTDSLFAYSMEYAEDFTKRMHGPKFSDLYEFYVFYSKYNGVNKEKVQEVVSVIRRNDVRVINLKKKKTFNEKLDEIKQNNKTFVPVSIKNKIKKTKEYNFYCKACERGFTNEKTLENHCLSKKHAEKALKNSSENIFIKPKVVIKEEAPVIKEEIIIKEEVLVKPIKPVEKPTRVSNEPIAFRTCSICKIVCNSRLETIKHIREEHN